MNEKEKVELGDMDSQLFKSRGSACSKEVKPELTPTTFFRCREVGGTVASGLLATGAGRTGQQRAVLVELALGRNFAGCRHRWDPALQIVALLLRKRSLLHLRRRWLRKPAWVSLRVDRRGCLLACGCALLLRGRRSAGARDGGDGRAWARN